jgi:16S rRNA (adenine1518-N6/adenine1519-N6)-dimethyltransferase
VIPPWSAVRSELAARGFRPSRRLGQNFLKDPNLARAIARDAGELEGRFVLEVGAGPGILTAALLERGARVLAVEVDARLVAVARALLGEPRGLELLHADALARKHALAPELVERLPDEGPWQVVSNLPYSSGTPVVMLLARLAHPPLSQCILIQAELAERMAAEPGTGSYGALSVRLQASYRVALLRDVAPELFWPRPAVASRVVRLELRPDRPPPAELAALDRTAQALFSGRRKSLRRLLGDLLGAEGAGAALAETGLAGDLRPEDVGGEGFLALARSPLGAVLGPFGPNPWLPPPDAL